MSYIYQLDRALLRRQIERLAANIKGRVLDVGSGSHNRYGALFAYESIVHMDIAPGPNVDVVGSADSMPFGDGEFDSVISTQVFEHLAKPEEAAAEIARVLKPGGAALITVPQWNELHEEPHDYWRYTKYGLQALFERQGLRMVACDQRGGYFSTRAQMKMRYLIDSLRLHERSWARLASGVFKVWGRTAMALDALDASAANRKHTIGWAAVFTKPYADTHTAR